MKLVLNFTLIIQDIRDAKQISSKNKNNKQVFCAQFMERFVDYGHVSRYQVPERDKVDCQCRRCHTVLETLASGYLLDKFYLTRI
jgi:hypothetical protein